MTMASLVLVMWLGSAQLVSLDTKDMELSDFLRLIGKMANMNVVLHPAVGGKVNLMVKDSPWQSVLELVLKNHELGKQIEGNTIRIAPIATFEAEFKQRTATEEARLNALPLQTYIYVLKYERAEDLAVIISRLLSPRGSVIVHPRRNALIVRDVMPPAEVPR